jgi:hypothetical protein
MSNICLVLQLRLLDSGVRTRRWLRLRLDERHRVAGAYGSLPTFTGAGRYYRDSS